uniref:AsIV-cont00064-ORF1 n=1 Tax=Apophua simplicipes ichnovirus TaxID=1329648 RepID=S5DMK8_9VIRU|nr:AsIV-cont00064-ORF1 [Apophua simplicipes ichnovirus]
MAGVMSRINHTMNREPTVFALPRTPEGEEAERRKNVIKRCLNRIFRLACIFGITIIAVVNGFGYSLIYLLITNLQRPDQDEILKALYELLYVTLLGALFLTLGLLCGTVAEIIQMKQIETEVMEEEIGSRFVVIWILFMMNYVVIIFFAAVFGSWLFRF